MVGGMGGWGECGDLECAMLGMVGLRGVCGEGIVCLGELKLRQGGRVYWRRFLGSFALHTKSFRKSETYFSAKLLV